MERLSRYPVGRRTMLALALGATSVLVAACGAGVASPDVANIGTTTTTTLASRAGSGGAAANDGAELRYAECMRANGVPSFPDPSSTGSFEISGVNPRSAVFQSAQTKCAKDLPGGGPPGPGTTTNPSPTAMAAMLKVSECMRAHGVTNFPDPTTTVPENALSDGGVISDRDGVILVLPDSLDMQSSLFRRAAKACNFPLSNR